MASKHKTGFEGWQDYVHRLVKSPAKWNAYDCDIQRAVSEFNQHLTGVAAFHPLDWHLVKAMTSVETGADKPEWKSSPRQIGNPGDPGLNALLDGKEGCDLILSLDVSLPTLICPEIEHIVKADVCHIGQLRRRDERMVWVARRHDAPDGLSLQWLF